MSGQPSDNVHPENLEKRAGAKRRDWRDSHRYTVIYECRPRNWSAGYVPGPARLRCHREDTKSDEGIREAIEFHIEGMRLHGETVPEPTIMPGTVTRAIG